MCNYAEDCSPYESLPLEDVIHKLEENSEVLMEWYESNLIQTNGTYFLVIWEINMLSKLEIKLSQTVQNKKS